MKDKLDSCSERVEINNLYLQLLDISHAKRTQKLMLDIYYSMRDLGTRSVMGVYMYLQMLDISHGKRTQKLILDIYSMRDLGTRSVMGVCMYLHMLDIRWK